MKKVLKGALFLSLVGAGAGGPGAGGPGAGGAGARPSGLVTRSTLEARAEVIEGVGGLDRDEWTDLCRRSGAPAFYGHDFLAALRRSIYAMLIVQTSDGFE